MPGGHPSAARGPRSGPLGRARRRHASCSRDVEVADVSLHGRARNALAPRSLHGLAERRGGWRRPFGAPRCLRTRERPRDAAAAPPQPPRVRQHRSRSPGHAAHALGGVSPGRGVRRSRQPRGEPHADADPARRVLRRREAGGGRRAHGSALLRRPHGRFGAPRGWRARRQLPRAPRSHARAHPHGSGWAPRRGLRRGRALLRSGAGGPGF